MTSLAKMQQPACDDDDKDAKKKQQHLQSSVRLTS